MAKGWILSAKQLQHLKSDPCRRMEIPAGPPAGLYVVVHPSGRKAFALRYRFHGAPRKLTFTKPYPDLSLAGARAEAQAALETLRDGIDPAQRQREEEPSPEMFEAVVSEFMERYAKKNKTWKQTERILKGKDVIEHRWLKRPVSQITTHDALRLLDSIADRAPIQANRTKAQLRKFFNWCRGRKLISQSPIDGIPSPTRERSRDRVLDPDEIAAIWNAVEPFGYPYSPYLRLLLLTAQRENEVATIQWEHLDLNAKLWTLPSERTKAGRVHDVPLSGQALEILNSLPRFVNDSFVFTTTGGKKPINGFSKLKERIDAAILRQREEAGLKGEPKPWRIHDLRRTAATWMAGAGVPPHVLGALLNHSPGKVMGITAVYNRFRYSEERRDALEKWSAHIEDLVAASKKEGKVIAARA